MTEEGKPVGAVLSSEKAFNGAPTYGGFYEFVRKKTEELVALGVPREKAFGLALERLAHIPFVDKVALERFLLSLESSPLGKDELVREALRQYREGRFASPTALALLLARGLAFDREGAKALLALVAS